MRRPDREQLPTLPSHRAKAAGRILLGMSAVALVAYGGGIAPLQLRNRELERKVGAMTQDVERARALVQKERNLETEASLARRALQSRLEDYPEGSAMVWLPGVVRKHFQQIGMETGEIRARAAVEEPALPGYRRAQWVVSLPVESAPAKLAAFLYAVADLEQQHEILKVIAFQVRPKVEEAQQFEAVLTIEAVIRE